MKYLALLLLACSACFAQKKFTVIDRETKKPVPYASVDLNNGYGTYADADGIAIISDSLVTHVTVTSIGYKEKKSTVSEIMDIITLEPQPIELQEVVVGGKKTKRKETVLKPKKHQNISELYMSSTGLQYAFLVATENKDAYLSKIVLPLIKAAFESEGRPGTFDKVQFHTLVKIDILENNNGMPGEKLYDFEQLATVSNASNDTQFDITLDEEIPIDEKGMFVQLTILGRAHANGSLTGDPGYSNYKDTDGTIKKWAENCQPNFPLIERPKGPLTFIREPFSKNRKWRTINEPHLHHAKQYPDFNIGFGYTTAIYSQK